MPDIILRNVQKSYSANSPKAVSDLDLHIGNGEFMCLLGPSGCGKTTTLRMIAGLENLSDGEIVVGDKVVDSPARAQFIGPEKRGMGLVFQSYALWPHLTIERNTDFGLRLRKVPKAEREERVTKVMKALDIEKYRTRYPSQLSGGQQQRVALARMLAVNPGVLLLDEPLSNLDARLRLEMRAELKRIHAEFRTTIVFVTHDQWEAMTLATSIAVMNEGTLQQLGTPNDIYDRPANRFVAEFVGSPPINILEIGAGHALDLAVNEWLRPRLGTRGEVGSVGIRPEALSFTTSEAAVPSGSFRHRAEIGGILPTGGSWIIELKVDGRIVFATTTEAPTLRGGETVWLHARPTALHVFDKARNRLEEADAALQRAASGVAAVKGA
ncbi:MULTISPECIES: ABC transporter ATP-binding protein [Devosia]|uniref:sn-glycerol-3-phosphate import ATP-binding protein UgpC n=1 Tax=Devosia equisanguinis TaxID=2490941 RepID=A0A3S4D745_9HYPH|nr:MULTISPECIES: ABC transporter ATP-binding protein [Devosia]ODT49237.1 MAG: ABC transporter ATP-binding protein [Pelagibacterium sp. SCN 63-126]ODU85618.1 MAG: ABC transporter ATP-binding protein [Pelagibacterium sp. SCN 63-17]OJX43460.1 MAG: ABC transporter ATP-binding protein [Devosia sp. 63-57]VDS05991.1 sn-glycerol-3-phosphate import ATP-binding protein UgpC [Devosia equisanguinis]